MKQSTYSTETLRVLNELGVQPIAYHPAFARAWGVKAAVLLSQLMYWHGKQQNTDGWIRKTASELKEEIALSEHEQETARGALVAAGVIEFKRKGTPAMPHYRINHDAIIDALIDKQVPAKAPNKSGGKRLTSQAGCSGDLLGGKRLSVQEITTENTAERGNARETSAHSPAIVATIPPTADVANSTALESPITAPVTPQPSPAKPLTKAPAHLCTMPAPNHKRPKWMGPAEPDKRISTYAALTGWRPNKLQEDDICQRVKPDDDAWEACIRKRMSFGCSIKRVGDAIDDYLAGGPVDFKAGRQPQPVMASDPPSRIEWVTTPSGRVLRYDGTPYPGEAGRQKCAELGIAFEGN